jgi:hypothetical protein
VREALRFHDDEIAVQAIENVLGRVAEKWPLDTAARDVTLAEPCSGKT